MMNSAGITEVALRKAVNASVGSFSRENYAETVKQSALDHAGLLVNANSNDVGSMLPQIDMQQMAIEAAVAGIVTACVAIKSQWTSTKEKRLRFEEERVAGIATMTFRTNIEEKELSVEEITLKAFINLTTMNRDTSKTFSHYLGIQGQEPQDIKNPLGASIVLAEETQLSHTFFSVLPFYRMSLALPEPDVAKTAVNKERMAIRLFLRTVVPVEVGLIDNDFKTDTSVGAFFKSTYQQANYLNYLRIPRFVMMSLANLLWNLQYPVDPDTGISYGLDYCIELCSNVQLYLNDVYSVLKPVEHKYTKLLNFVNLVENHVKFLQIAFVEEKLHHIQFHDLVNSSKRALRIMENGIFKLIYKQKSTYEPDVMKTEWLAWILGFLNQLLTRNTKLIQRFIGYLKYVPINACINRPPMTVIDTIIIFSHLPTHQRHKLINGYSESIVTERLFKITLQLFYRIFAKPLSIVSKMELGATHLNPMREEVAKRTARRLIPLITLVAQDREVIVDTKWSEELAEESKRPDQLRRYLGKEQVEQINQLANHGGAASPYVWELTPFINLDGETDSVKLAGSALNKLPTQLHRMIQITTLLENVSEIVSSYRSFLQHKPFQVFLTTCFRKIRDEYLKLDRKIEAAYAAVQDSEYLSSDLKGILQPMLKNLDKSLDDFDLAMHDFERIVGSPEFTQQERELLSSKMKSIDSQFTRLFEADSGIGELVSGVPVEQRVASDHVSDSAHVHPTKILALDRLIKRCYDAMSYQSKQGYKGKQVRALMHHLQYHQGHFTDAQVKYVILELTRLTASYRESWFFQAPYGQTRSAQALIAAIKDVEMNNILQLASIIFDDKRISFSSLRDEDIVKRLNALRESHQWSDKVVSSSPVDLLSFATHFGV